MNVLAIFASGLVLSVSAGTDLTAPAEAPAAAPAVVAAAPEPAVIAPAPAADEVAPTATVEQVAAPAAEPLLPVLEVDTDEIDLDEIDDTASLAARPKVNASAGTTEYVDISCDDATLADVLRQFRKTTHANIICEDSTNYTRRVSAELKHVQWVTALESILNSRGFRLEQRGNIYFVSEDLRVEPVFTRSFQLNHAAADELAALFNDTYAPRAPDGKVKGKIANAFPEANVVVVTANPKILDDCASIIEAIDKAVAQIYIEARFLELSSEAMHKLGIQWDALKSWSMSVGPVTGGFTVNNGKAANYGETLDTRSDTSTVTDSRTETVTADASGSASATSTKSPTSTTTGTSTYSGLVPTDIGSAAREAITAADMAWRNAYGFSGQFTASEFALALSAFESLGEGRLFSNPKIIVSNGKEAKVDMTTKEPNVTIDSNFTGVNSQNMSISTRLEAIPGNDTQMFAGDAFFSYGISLTVKPRISPDGLISVEIVPTISEFLRDKEVRGASENAVYTTYPIIKVKRLTTNFTMKDGCTAVIGGLTQTSEQDVDSGIPYLRKIPWVGPKLFGWKSREKVQNEIVVCVTLGIANPAELPTDVGLPKNAIMSREYIDGTRQEPGDRKGDASKVLTLDMRSLEEQNEDYRQDSDEAAPGEVIVKPSAE